MNIISNGSKWDGEAPDTVAHLLEVLGREPLDPTFEEYGDFVFWHDPAIPPSQVRVWGNFLNLSHVFSIEGTRDEMAPLIAAIRANQERQDYRDARRAPISRWLNPAHPHRVALPPSGERATSL